MAVVLALLGAAAHLRAQEPDDLRRGVARISMANGEVSVQRGDSGEWVAAAVNAPLLTNDRISSGPDSRAEIQFDSGNILRIGGGADITLSQLEANRFQMAIGRGTVTYRLIRNTNSDIELDTPNVSVRPSKVGTYRISVTDTGDSEVIPRAGDVEVFTPRGSQWVSFGQAMLARGSASDPEFQIVQARAVDEWDRWSDGRDRTLLNSPSTRNVPPGVYGTEDLDPYGRWVDVPQYGNVWQPVQTAGWAPYQAGRWVWLDWYGWTWVSYEPWGWAPYHYGRWFYEPAFGWCWYPGAIGVRHYWSPALVAFFGFGGGGVGFGFGNVGWVPLAPYEVLHPWWGRGFYGGPGYFNRSVVNVNIVNTYRNARVVNGFTAVSSNDFRSGRFNNFVRPSAAELSQASFARGPIPVTPERGNLRYADRQVGFVPRTASPRVFSYRQPTPVQRGTFAEQQRGFQQNPAPGRTFGSSTENTQSPASRGWTRFGATAGQPGAPMQSGGAQPNPAGGWQRFGEPRPQQAAPPSFNSGSRPEPLRIAPPVVRERPYNNAPSFGNRPSSGGGFGARQGGGGSFSAPPAPRQRSGNGGGFSAAHGSSAPRSSGGGSREGRRR
ncbi:MAG: hypothetical protein JO323_13735 [Acidobacteriia bacterium]|nr:hypothetical protein [Terriglobia bacterium]